MLLAEPVEIVMEPVIDKKVRPCILCHCLFDENILIPMGLLHENIHKSIQADCPSVCHPGKYICRTDLAKYTPWVGSASLDDEGHIFASATEIESICTFKDRCVDILTICVGSWSFLIGSCVIIGFWVYINTNFLLFGKFDPYPFIFLNLILSIINAIQAPVILMSQNRLAEVDRARATYDYGIDLKAELGIRKIDENIKLILQKIEKNT